MDGGATLCAVDGSIYCFAASTGPGRATLAPHSAQSGGATSRDDTNVQQARRSTRAITPGRAPLATPRDRAFSSASAPASLASILWVRLLQEVHRRRELEVRAAFERGKLLSIEHELTVMTDPLGPGPPSPYRATPSTREFLK